MYVGFTRHCASSGDMRTYFVRHGETVWNRERRLQGQADSPLTLRGAQLAVSYGRHLAEALAGLDLEDAHQVGFYVSPLGRTRQTASLIADCLGVNHRAFQIEPLLAEHHVGTFAGMLWDHIEAEHGVSPKTWRNWTTRPPEGETREEVLERTRTWLKQDHGHDVAIVVSHGGLSRAFRAAYLELDAEARMAIQPHPHGSMFRFEDGHCEQIVVADAPQNADSPLG